MTYRKRSDLSHVHKEFTLYLAFYNNHIRIPVCPLEGLEFLLDVWYNADEKRFGEAYEQRGFENRRINPTR